MLFYSEHIRIRQPHYAWMPSVLHVAFDYGANPTINFAVAMVIQILPLMGTF